MREGLVCTALAVLCLLPTGCVGGFSEEDLLGFTPDGKTVVYTRDDKVFVGIVFGIMGFGIGPHSIHLAWRDVDSPETVRRIRLCGEWITFPDGGNAQDPPWDVTFSPGSRHLAIRWEEELLLVDLKEGKLRKVDGPYPFVGQVTWLSDDELIFDTALGTPDEFHGVSRHLIYRWRIDSPTDDLQVVCERQTTCWSWSLSPDHSCVLIGPQCSWGRCELVDLSTGQAVKFGPEGVRLGASKWTDDSSRVFCELQHKPSDPDAERDTGPREYVLVSRRNLGRILADHGPIAPRELGRFLGFSEDNQWVFTSMGLRVRPDPWEVRDLTESIVELCGLPPDCSIKLGWLPVRGWFSLTGPDEKTYAVNAQCDKVVPLPDIARSVISPDGKRIATERWRTAWGIKSVVDIRELEVPIPPGR